MNLKEKLKEAIATLTNVKKAVEKGEKSAADLQEAIDKVQELQEKLKAAEDAENILNTIGTPGEKNPEKPMQAKSLGEHFANVVRQKGRIAPRAGFNIIAPDFVKAASDVQMSPAGAVDFATTFDRNVVSSSAHSSGDQRSFRR